jgi:1,4-alpha-glucan branching enzyme
MTPVERPRWFLKMKQKSEWCEVFNSDKKEFWGTDHFINDGVIKTQKEKDGEQYLSVHLPPLAGCVFKKLK